MVWVMLVAALVGGPEVALQEDHLEEAAAASTRAEDDTGPTPGVATVSLAAAIDRAFEGNFQLLGAADDLTGTRLRENATKATFLPQVTPRYTRNDDLSTFTVTASQRLPWLGGALGAAALFQDNTASTGPFTHTSDVRLTLVQPLLRGAGPNAASYDVKNARRATEGQERSFVLSRQQVTVQVTAAFYRVVQQRHLRSVARQSLRRNRELLDASQRRLEVGLVSKLDVFRAELQAAQAEEALVRAETALETALEQFRVLLGLAPEAPLEPEAALLPEALEEPEPLEVLLARAREFRLDLQETRDRVQDAKRTLALARQNVLPQLDVQVSVAQVGQSDSYGGAFGVADTQVAVNMTTSYPLQRTQVLTERASAELSLGARERDLEQRLLSVDSEVRSAWRELSRIRQSVDLQRRSVDVAAQQLRLATLRYQRGLASNFDVVDAESNLVLARSTLVTLLASYQVAIVDLRRVTGELGQALPLAAAPAGMTLTPVPAEPAPEEAQP